MRRVAFLFIALTVLLADRVSKEGISSLLSSGAPIDLLGSSLRLIRSENRGGLFGLLQGSAPLLALLSLGVIALLIVVHEREGRQQPSLLTLALALLIGGALGNLVDRLANGFVFDFIDIGIGTTRFWTFNVADMEISLGILLLLVETLIPWRVTSAGSASE
jgi:signal peptidase II